MWQHVTVGVPEPGQDTVVCSFCIPTNPVATPANAPQPAARAAAPTGPQYLAATCTRGDNVVYIVDTGNNIEIKGVILVPVIDLAVAGDALFILGRHGLLWRVPLTHLPSVPGQHDSVTHPTLGQLPSLTLQETSADDLDDYTGRNGSNGSASGVDASGHARNGNGDEPMLGADHISCALPWARVSALAAPSRLYIGPGMVGITGTALGDRGLVAVLVSTTEGTLEYCALLGTPAPHDHAMVTAVAFLHTGSRLNTEQGATSIVRSGDQHAALVDTSFIARVIDPALALLNGAICILGLAEGSVYASPIPGAGVGNTTCHSRDMICLVATGEAVLDIVCCCADSEQQSSRSASATVVAVPGGVSIARGSGSRHPGPLINDSLVFVGRKGRITILSVRSTMSSTGASTASHTMVEMMTSAPQCVSLSTGFDVQQSCVIGVMLYTLSHGALYACPLFETPPARYTITNGVASPQTGGGVRVSTHLKPRLLDVAPDISSFTLTPLPLAHVVVYTRYGDLAHYNAPRALPESTGQVLSSHEVEMRTKKCVEAIARLSEQQMQLQKQVDGVEGSLCHINHVLHVAFTHRSEVVCGSSVVKVDMTATTDISPLDGSCITLRCVAKPVNTRVLTLLLQCPGWSLQLAIVPGPVSSSSQPRATTDQPSRVVTFPIGMETLIPSGSGHFAMTCQVPWDLVWPECAVSATLVHRYDTTNADNQPWFDSGLALALGSTAVDILDVVQVSSRMEQVPSHCPPQQQHQTIALNPALLQHLGGASQVLGKLTTPRLGKARKDKVAGDSMWTLVCGAVVTLKCTTEEVLERGVDQRPQRAGHKGSHAGSKDVLAPDAVRTVTVGRIDIAAHNLGLATALRACLLSRITHACSIGGDGRTRDADDDMGIYVAGYHRPNDVLDLERLLLQYTDTALKVQEQYRVHRTTGAANLVDWADASSSLQHDLVTLYHELRRRL